MRPNIKTQALFVEGQSDASVVNKLVKLRLGIDLAEKNQRIVRAVAGEGGFDSTLEQFRAALEAKRPERLGLLVDRDGHEGRADRWPRIVAVLQSSGLVAPSSPPAGGVRAVTATQRVGVWLMPNNTTSGDLETFLEGLLPEPRPALWEYAAMATTTSLSHGARFRSVQQAKAKLHAYLAWQDPPGNPYGTAVEAGVIGVQSTAADALVEWLNWLFGE